MVSKRQILIVEDNLLNREILVEILADQYTVLQAENGHAALEILKQNKDSISLILLDVMMPVMDGYAFLDQIKKDEDLSLIPVIVMTQSDNEKDEVSALEHGATDFLPKPYRPQVILHRVASLIKLREEAAIINQYRYDRLTGLYNKEFFFQKVQERLLEDPEREYSIVFSNIEDFKLFNDLFGSKQGDLLLKEVANITREMVGDTGFCGRFGADHFVCLQERGQEQLDRQNFGGFTGKSTPPIMRNVVIRWGIYEITDKTVSVEQMCDRAMLAAYSIKGQYNQFFAVYDDTLRGKLLREKAITDAMENALKENQFAVYLQPKYSLNDESMVGAEALVRWNHPEWGFMSPGEFIPLFEKNGFISRLDQYVWDRVCSLLHDWKEKGYPLLPVSVNVSRADIYQLHLEDVLPQITSKYGIDPAYLHLEITESAYAKNPDQIINTAVKLRKLGFVIEMDDFGSGYSSLNMLSQMKLDILKMDMIFIRNEISKPAEQSILNDIINMSHRMHLKVVAEGVENCEQMKRLQSAGCDYVQGYYFAKPMPTDDFEALWKVQCKRPTSLSPEAFFNDLDIPALLVIDEDARFREQIRITFEGDYRITEASDATYALSCLNDEKHGSFSAVLLSMTLPDNGATCILKAMRQDPAFWNIPIIAIIPNGEMAQGLTGVTETDDFLCRCHPLFDLRKRVKHLTDLAEYHKRDVVLKEEAYRDYLTGLLNRRGFHVAVSSLRAENLPLAVCLFDLDDLKKVNDIYGHDMGDRMILSFADLIRSRIRSEDIQCRYGGDEFIVILKHVNNAETAMKKGEEICRAFHECFAEEPISPSCSCGIAFCETNGIPFDELITRADQALYLAKKEAKGGCRV